ncbi:helix-turn-helix transcriptional regulator [Billgrantia sp. C5P2]|uniref:helix-turn-helix transcriptional regulator n=1 Tax=Billgrantia sp. C5P2 TaxID=3436239 RepID=UPI003DA41EB1
MSDPTAPDDLTEGHKAIIRLLAKQGVEAYLQNRVEQRPLRFLKTREVCEKIACSKAKLYELREQDETFPKPFKDGAARSSQNYWFEHEIEEWMQRWAEARRDKASPLS